MGNMELLCSKFRGIRPHIAVRGKSHGFSRILVGTWSIFLSYSGDDPLKALVCSATSGLLSTYEGHLTNLLKAWQGNTDASRGEAGDPGSLTGCHSDTGININFQQESGLVTF